MTGAPAFPLEHFFRRESGRLVAALVRSLGSAYLDLAEGAVQEAFLRALRVWPIRGMPDQPDAWLYRTARNCAIDELRRTARFDAREADVARDLEAVPLTGAEAHFPGEIVDDQLRLIFLCCHPALTAASRVALTLHVAAGFSTGEIARAFLATESSIAQRIVRAKRDLREIGAPFELPPPAETAARLDDVLDVLYLIFSEGYRPHAGDAAVRADVMEDAVRLTRLVLQHPTGREPRVEALLALMLFQSSRAAARVNAQGALVPLEDQDRALWDESRIRQALIHLSRGGRGDALTEYHLLAGIAACHATATGADTTDWARVVQLYDELVARGSGDVVLLNRAVAISYRDGAAAALNLVRELARSPALATYPLLYAVRADLLRRTNQHAAAASDYREAARLAENIPERLYYESRAAQSEDSA